MTFLLTSEILRYLLNCEGRSSTRLDRLKLNPHTTFVVEVEGVIDVQGVQHTNSIQQETGIYASRIHKFKNWCPIILRNYDYKIASKNIANRIQKILPKLI